MSNLKERLKADLVTSMKSKDVFKRDVIRFVQSAIKQVEVDTREVLDDEAVLKILQKLLKQRMDSIEQFKAASRDDLVEKEQKEAELLKSYLPEQLSLEELSKIIKAIIQEVGATSMKDIGKVMGVAMKKTEGKADGGAINQIAKELLG